MVALTLAGAGCGRNRRPPGPSPPATTASGAAPAGFAVPVLTRTAGFRHASIQNGVAAIRRLGRRHGFAVDDTADAARIGPGLARYRAVVFLSTTGDLLDPGQQAALERYLHSGDGWVGVHGAADAEYDWPWYSALVGAQFRRHPAVQAATVVVDPAGRSLAGPVPEKWRRSDEWYDFRADPRGRVRVLATVDETTYDGGGMGADHPIAWCHDYDGGRSWYTAMGHTVESFHEPLYVAHLAAGLRYVTGQSGAGCPPTS